MLLIKDHMRMKHDSAEPYDGTHSTQFNLLPIPEDWAAASEEFPSAAKGESPNEQ